MTHADPDDTLDASKIAMTNTTVTDDDLRRLKAERDEADRVYNEALTAVDKAMPARLTHPTPLPSPDDHQLPALNRLWAPQTSAVPGGWRRLRSRVVQFVKPLVRLLPWQQRAFNTALVDHLNRSSARDHATRDAITRSLDGLHDDLGAMAHVQVQRLRCLQQIAPFVDTKVPPYALDALRLPRSLAEGLSALGDDMSKRWESVVAREQRLEASVASLAGSHAEEAVELRLALSTLQRSAAVTKREVERGLAAMHPASLQPAPAAGSVPEGESDPPRESGRSSEGVASAHDVAESQLAGSALDSFKYASFEDTFRGSAHEISHRLADYVPLFTDASDVLDLGCGRGEFLDLLRERGVGAQGVDINHEMVEICRARGLQVSEGDGLAHLEALPDGAIGGLFASQVVEHFQPQQLQRLLDLAFHKLRPGALVVLETINPACWFAFFESYLRDITHVRPIHPDTLKFLLRASGFQRVEIRYLAPYPDAGKLQPIPISEHRDPAAIDPLVEVAETFNANVDKINRLIFTYLDYAAIAVRP